MCFYITATLPKNTDIKSVRNILEKYNMAFTQVKNAVIISQLRPNELYFHATKDYCDCDTSLGVLNQAKLYQKLLESKKVKTLRKKKWTEDQINEWIRNKSEKNPPHGKKSITESERQLDIDRWRSFIQAMLKNSKRIGLIKHWYTGSLENEEISIKRTEKISIKDLTDDYLLNFEEDVLYEFFPQYK